MNTYIVTDFVPEDCDYLTAGKWYLIIRPCSNGVGAYVVVDSGFEIMCLHCNCGHLNGKDWQVKRCQPPEGYVEDEHGNWSPPAMKMAEAIDLVPTVKLAPSSVRDDIPASKPAPLSSESISQMFQDILAEVRANRRKELERQGFPFATDEDMQVKETEEPLSNDNDTAELKLEWGKKYIRQGSDLPVTYLFTHKNLAVCEFACGDVMGVDLDLIIGPYREKLRMPVGGCPTGYGWVAREADGDYYWHDSEPREDVDHFYSPNNIPIPKRYWPINCSGPWQESATPVSQIEFYDAEVE